ncbi:hypothetical protein [Xanthomonas oryzae]|uniref:hypothetical protein n=1 Tax=Xanthomonas oryzae TaxID=347 RepID=UPI003DA0E974
MWFHVKTYRDKNGRIRRYKTVELRRIDNSGGQRRYTLVGSLDRNAASLPRDLAKKLTTDEKRQFAEWCVRRDAAEKIQLVEDFLRLNHNALAAFPEVAARAGLALSPRLPIEAASYLWTSIEVLSRELTRSGFPRPRRDRRGRPNNGDELSPIELLRSIEDQQSAREPLNNAPQMRDTICSE